MDNSSYVGCYVVFTGDQQRLRIGVVKMIDPYGWEGTLGVGGDRGLYVFRPEEVRLAEEWEIQQWITYGSLG